MKSLFVQNSIIIPARKVISRTFSENMRLDVLHGRVWITQSGMPEDFWLGAGESLMLESGRLTVIEADKETSAIKLASATQAVEKTGFERKLDTRCC